MGSVKEKDPNATSDYFIDWSAWLDGDTIATSNWTVPTGLTAGTGQQAPSNTTTKATIWISGGTAGVLYTLTNRITTTGGRTDERTLYIKVEER